MERNVQRAICEASFRRITRRRIECECDLKDDCDFRHLRPDRPSRRAHTQISSHHRSTDRYQQPRTQAHSVAKNRNTGTPFTASRSRPLDARQEAAHSINRHAILIMQLTPIEGGMTASAEPEPPEATVIPVVVVLLKSAAKPLTASAVPE